MPRIIREMTMPRIITGQHFLDDAIVEWKRFEEDYSVMLSPPFGIAGVEYQVILDGNHSYAAAMADDVEPDFTIATPREHDAVGLLNSGDLMDFLASVDMGEGGFIDAESRTLIW